MTNLVKKILDEQVAAIQKLSSEKIQIFSQYIISAAEKKNFIWIAGNGGSATTAAHLATDLNKGIFLATQLQFRAICLNELLRHGQMTHLMNMHFQARFLLSLVLAT